MDKEDRKMMENKRMDEDVAKRIVEEYAAHELSRKQDDFVFMDLLPEACEIVCNYMYNLQKAIGEQYIESLKNKG